MMKRVTINRVYADGAFMIDSSRRLRDITDGTTKTAGQSVVPEPTTLLLVMIGSACLFAFRRSFRQKE